MRKNLKINRTRWIKIKFVLLVLFLFLNLFYIFNQNNLMIDATSENEVEQQEMDKSYHLRSSAISYFINFTNWEINNTRHYSGTNITIKGLVYDPIPPYNGVPDINVSIVVDDNADLYYPFSNITDSNGVFNISFTIPNDLDIYKGHKIEVKVNEDKEVRINHHYISSI